MSFFQKFPYTDDHQLNLDWIMRAIKGLKGGSKGQILAKASNKDFDYTWVPGADFEVFQTIQEIGTKATKDYVLILENHSSYGDGGPCWFKVSDTWDHHGWTRPDGRHMYPLLDQCPPLSAAPPVRELWGVMKSYIENSALVYGNDHTLYSETVTNEIDCADFVEAVLEGIPYEASRYVNGSAGTNRQTVKISSLAPDKNATLGHLLSFDLGQFMGEHKLLHSMPTVDNIAQTLQFGDILFINANNAIGRGRYLHINHVALVLGTYPVKNGTEAVIVVAQVGGAGTAITLKNNKAVSTDGGTISTLTVSQADIDQYLCAWARIPFYSYDTKTTPPITNTGFVINPVWIPNSFIASSLQGIQGFNTHYCVSYDFTPVQPGCTITYTGATTGDNGSLEAYIAEYDSKYQFISMTAFHNSPLTLTADTTFIRFQFGYSADDPVTISDMDSFKATIEVSATDLGFRASYIEHLITAPVLIGTTATAITFTRPLSDYDLILFSCFNGTSAVGTLIFNGSSRDTAVINGLKLTNSGTERTMTITIAADKASASGVMSGGSYSLDVHGIKF